MTNMEQLKLALLTEVCELNSRNIASTVPIRLRVDTKKFPSILRFSWATFCSTSFRQQVLPSSQCRQSLVPSLKLYYRIGQVAEIHERQLNGVEMARRKADCRERLLWV